MEWIMRISITMLLTLLISFSAFSAAKFVQPKKNGVGIYKNETRGVNESALETVGVDARLKVLKESKNYYQVKGPSATGWVEKYLVAEASGKAFTFDDAEVMGYLDNPTPVYIIDADSKDATPIQLDRSFAEALRQNVDRETVERQVK